MRRWMIQACEYPGCEVIEEEGSVTHSHPHRTKGSPSHTETPLSDPIEVVPLSEVKEALEEADQALTAWHADEPFYDPGSDSSEPFTQDAEFVTFIGHAVRDLLAALPSDSER